MRLLIFFSSVLLLIQCSEKEPYKPEVEVFPVNGVNLFYGDEPVVRVEQDKVVSNTINLPLDGDSPQILVVFTADGEPYDPGKSATLGVQMANPAIATAAIVPSDTLKFVLHGKSVGQTTMTVKLLYSNTPRYQSPDIAVTVSN